MSPKQSMPVLRRFLPAERRFCYGTEGPEGSSAAPAIARSLGIS